MILLTASKSRELPLQRTVWSRTSIALRLRYQGLRKCKPAGRTIFILTSQERAHSLTHFESVAPRKHGDREGEIIQLYNYLYAYDKVFFNITTPMYTHTHTQSMINNDSQYSWIFYSLHFVCVGGCCCCFSTNPLKSNGTPLLQMMKCIII